MNRRNDGVSDQNIWQNRFTAYLTTAIRRRKIRYMQTKARVVNNETCAGTLEYTIDYRRHNDVFSELPLIEQIEEERLYLSLKHIGSVNLRIFLSRAVEGMSFVEIAADTGLSYKNVTTTYYRIIKRLRKELGVR